MRRASGSRKVCVFRFVGIDVDLRPSSRCIVFYYSRFLDLAEFSLSDCVRLDPAGRFANRHDRENNCKRWNLERERRAADRPQPSASFWLSRFFFELFLLNCSFICSFLLMFMSVMGCSSFESRQLYESLSIFRLQST